MQPVRNQVRQLWEKSKAALSRPMPLDEPTAQVGVWLERDEVAMGTAIRVELWCEDAARGQMAIDEVMAEMHRIDRTMSPHKADSELSRINRDAGREAVEEATDALNREVFETPGLPEVEVQALTARLTALRAGLGDD